MTNYEMLQTLLNDSNLQKSIVEHLACGKVELILKESKSNIYLLDVKIIEVSKSVELLMYTETFEIGLDDRGSVRDFFIQMIDHVTVNDALESAKLGKIVEDFLRSKLN